ncbi:MAG: DUF448 domain-containing protein [Acidimicrobiales bacterium]
MAPTRTCIVCRSRRDDADMVRAGRNAAGTWYLGRGAGRGVWWCGDRGCGKDVRASHVARALRVSVSESDVVVLHGLATRKRP